jgi:ADP-glucose pyrophosphorylase
VFEHFLTNNMEVHAHVIPGYWNDIGSFDAYLDAHQHAGMDLEIPESLRAPELENTFEGVNHIDSSSRIFKSRISNCIILSGCDIQESELEHCIVDHDASILKEKRSDEIIRAS